MDSIQLKTNKCYCCLSLKTGVLMGIFYGVASSLFSIYNLNMEAVDYPDVVGERYYFFKLSHSDIVWDALEILRINMYLIGLSGYYYNSQQLLQTYFYLRCVAISYSPYLIYQVVAAVIYQEEEDFQDKALTQGPVTTRKLIKLGIFSILALILVVTFLGVQAHDAYVVYKLKELLSSKDETSKRS